jgi:Uma2 family endonuclease
MTVSVRTTPLPRAAEFPRKTTPARPPSLEPGDRLTRREFERRYQAMPNLKKAELIEGVVYMPSPVHASHATAHSQIITWLGTYCAATQRVKLADNATVRLDPDNVVQPDVLLRLEPLAGGRSRISPDDYIEGAPELVIEIATSSAAYDLHDKLRVYRRNRVQEYVVWQVLEGKLDWWRWDEGEYVPVAPDARGVFASQTFAGLWLDAKAMLNGDLAAALACLQEGLASDDHAGFVARIANAAPA